MIRQVEHTRFYEELDKLRRDDAASPSGKESDRALGARLGITNKTITLYRRGAMPKASTILQIVEKGGYGSDMFQRLSAAAAGSEIAKPITESAVEVFSSEDVGRGGPKKKAKSLFDFVPPKFVTKKVSIPTLACIKMSEDFIACEPRIPRGSCILYTEAPCEPENYRLYVFITEKGAVPRMIRVHGRQLWWSKSSLDDLEKIEKDDFVDNVLGEIVMILNLSFRD